jgi:large subunit ribosomal protein LX
MGEKIFLVHGHFSKQGFEKKFEKKVKAVNEKQAMERILSQFGSKNKIKRRDILIEEVKEEKVK